MNTLTNFLHRIPCPLVILSSYILFLFTPVTVEYSFAQEGAYHAALRTQLQSEFGVTGGAWVIADDENETNASHYTSGNYTVQTSPVTGEVFTRSMRLNITQRGQNPWDYFIGFPTVQGLTPGDKALLIVWVRGIDADRGSGLVNANFEMNSNPYTKSLFTGMIPSDEWQQWLIPFEASISHPAGQAQLIFHLGIMAQEVEMAGVAILNYGQAYALDELPATNQEQNYAGREPGAAWRTEAASRIDQYRKRDVKVRVVDNRGVLVEGAGVSVNMKRHRFGFGTAIAVSMMLQQGVNAATYREKVENLAGDGRTFSTAVLENALKWGPWENPAWPGTKAQTVGVIRDLKDAGMTVRGHNLVWPDWQWMPAEAEQLQNNPTALRQLIQDRIADVAGYPGIKGELIDWDVLNEPAHLPTVAEAFAGQPGYPTGEEIYAEWFQQAAMIDPEAKLYINEYSVLSSSGFDAANQERYQAIISKIESEGGRIDGIGMQAHMGAPMTAPEVVYEIIDEFAASGKRIAITEYDASGVDETLAGDYMRDFLTMVFSHPSVDAFLMWGFWDGAHWKNDAPMFRQDWSLKPSGQAFLDLVFNTWWSEDSGQSDVAGEFTTRGFLSDYEITVDYEGAQVTLPVSIEAGEEAQEVSVALPRQVSIGEHVGMPKDYELYPNYPQPASSQTAIRFTLPVSGNVKLEIFDLLGRKVDELVHEDKPAGWHQVVYDTGDLPAGLYVYGLTADRWQAHRNLIVVR